VEVAGLEAAVAAAFAEATMAVAASALARKVADLVLARRAEEVAAAATAATVAGAAVAAPGLIWGTWRDHTRCRHHYCTSRPCTIVRKSVQSTLRSHRTCFSERRTGFDSRTIRCTEASAW